MRHACRRKGPSRLSSVGIQLGRAVYRDDAGVMRLVADSVAAGGGTSTHSDSRSEMGWLDERFESLLLVAGAGGGPYIAAREYDTRTAADMSGPEDESAGLAGGGESDDPLELDVPEACAAVDRALLLHATGTECPVARVWVAACHPCVHAQARRLTPLR